MSSFTFYTASIARSTKALNALTAILKKGQAADNVDSLPAARLHDDMLPLTMQVFIACAHATKLVGRATGVELPHPENNITSFDDMFACIAATQALAAGADVDVVNKRADETVPFEIGPDQVAHLSVATLAEDYYLPNVFFHVVTAYDILRKEGVSLGKADYEDAFMAKHLGSIG